MALALTLVKEHTQPYYIRRIRLTGFTANTPEDIAHGGPTLTYPNEVAIEPNTLNTDNAAVVVGVKQGATASLISVDNNAGAGAVAGLIVDLVCKWYSNADSPQNNGSLANQNY